MKNSQFRQFVVAYLECALWSSIATTGPDMEEDDYIRMESYGIDDIAPRERVKAMHDCRDFWRSNRETLDASKGSASQHGGDFWLTRNRHGAGFWDRGYGKFGEELTRNAHSYGGRYLCVGDDGQIYGF
jgi:hypothetical protein